MAKKKSWFNLVKRLFIWDTGSKQEKKEKRRKWIFGRLKKKRLPSITAPPPSKEIEQNQAVEEQSKHALTVAIATTVTAAEVVKLTGIPQSCHQCIEKTEEFQLVKSRNDAPQPIYQCQREIRESASIKIQTAFRAYLAKKALRALKGIVKLQAIIRGRAVRRRAMSTLKCLQSIVDIQSKICARRLKMVEGRWDYDENEEMPSSRDKIIMMDSNSERRWDDRISLKEETVTSYISKKEAVVKRERIKEHSFNHRRSAESERNKVNGRWRYWLEQWVDTQMSKSKELEDLDTVFSSHSRAGEEENRGRQLKLRNIQRQNQAEGLYSPKVSPRKSFPHRRQSSVGDDHSISSSPAIPAYMAATESAKAKARSTSSPKLRTGYVDSNFDSNSPCKKKLSLVSINSEVLSNGWKLSGNQQGSPSLKGISGPIKSSRTMNDLSINSDSSLPNWVRHSAFK